MEDQQQQHHQEEKQKEEELLVEELLVDESKVKDEPNEENSMSLNDEMGGEYKDEPEEEKKDEFVNVGLQRWEVERARWLSTTMEATTTTTNSKQTATYETKAPRHAIELDIDEVIDCVFSNRWRQTPQTGGRGGGGRGSNQRGDDGSFPCPVPLPQMVDILVDLWEAEGLDM